MEASINAPTGLVFDPDGSFYIVEHDRLRRVDKQGRITTLVGAHPPEAYYYYGGSQEYPTTVQPGAESVLFSATEIYPGPDGSMYIGEWGGIRRLDKDGMLRPVLRFGAEPVGDLWSGRLLVLKDGTWIVSGSVQSVAIAGGTARPWAGIDNAQDMAEDPLTGDLIVLFQNGRMIRSKSSAVLLVTGRRRRFRAVQRAVLLSHLP